MTHMKRFIPVLVFTIAACGGPGIEPVSGAVDSVPDVPIRASVAYGAIVAYGEGPSQYGELTIPAEPGKLPVVVLMHGGFWKAAYGLDLMQPLAADLNERGYATWNIEYRRVGEPGGGYPNTLLDVAAAIDRLATIDQQDRLDLDRVAVVGHSAGGHLALWGAARETIPVGEPGAGPAVIPRVAVGQAAVVDLAEAAIANLGGGAVQDLLGGDLFTVPDRYAAAQPDLAGATARIILVHGEFDLIVPMSQSIGAEQFGAEIVLIPYADHFDMIDPTHDAWAAVLSALASL